MFWSAYKYPESNIQFVSDYIVKGIFFLQLRSKQKESVLPVNEWLEKSKIKQWKNDCKALYSWDQIMVEQIDVLLSNSFFEGDINQRIGQIVCKNRNTMVISLNDDDANNIFSGSSLS